MENNVIFWFVVTISIDWKCHIHLWVLMMVTNQVTFIAYITAMFFDVLIIKGVTSMWSEASRNGLLYSP